MRSFGVLNGCIFYLHSQVRFPVGAVEVFFSLRHCVQTGPGAHPIYYPIDVGDSLPGSKAAGV